MDFYLEKELENVRVIDIERKYWFLRTYGGELYDKFLNEGFVGFGFNNVPYNYIKEADLKNSSAFKTLQTFIEKNTDYRLAEATKWANQLIAFEHIVSIDDIVIIPSKNSEYLAFGIVESDTYLSKEEGTFIHKDSFEQFPEKRKRVKWIKIINKHELQGDLRGLLASHAGLTSAVSYGEIIEGNLSSLFIKGERIYFTIKINQDEDINAFDLNRFLNSLTYFYKEFCVENDVPENEELFIKIRVQSRGKMALSALGVVGIIGIAGLLALSNNTELEMEIGGNKVKGRSDGFFKSYSDFLDRDQRRQIEFEKFQDSMKKLKADTVADSITPEIDSLSKSNSSKNKSKNNT
jgi:hypothetical protein